MGQSAGVTFFLEGVQQGFDLSHVVAHEEPLQVTAFAHSGELDLCEHSLLFWVLHIVPVFNDVVLLADHLEALLMLLVCAYHDQLERFVLC